MVITSLELTNFRNYDSLKIDFDKGTNILYGDNAQGKTNVLEAIYFSATTKSHKGSKDKEAVNFNCEEAHIRTNLSKGQMDYRIDMHLRKNKTKAIAINGQKCKKAAELLGLLNVVVFSPEDLSIIKSSPAYRRNFVDRELCQINKSYLFNLDQYNKIVNQRNKLLKDYYNNPDLKSTIGVWDEQLLDYGKKIIETRREFVKKLNDIIYDIHYRLSGQKEELTVIYEPNVLEEDYEKSLSYGIERDLRMKNTGTGPHKDDFGFMVNSIDIRKYGSQGQQRTAALSLKLAEIEILKNITGDTPVLLLDDVLSELDSSRQNLLLNNIGGVQTIITCTGLDDFIDHRFEINKVFKVVNGSIEGGE
ncbi:MAG: DNA replication/repair protein RecF [Lachnospiraceae bacterium]|nr:DNA replication/repair protein RecF [Lachnospiraceae bacterium]